MGWLIAAAIVLALLLLPLGVSVRYGEAGVKVCLTVGPVRKALHPTAHSAQKKKKDDKPNTQAPAEARPSADTPKGGSLAKLMPLLKLVPDFLGDLRRKLRVRRLEARLVLAGDDPADLALTYAKTWTAVGNLIPRLDRWLVIRHRDIRVDCDFAAEETTVAARVDVDISLGRLLGLASKYGLRAIRIFQQQKTGGVST